MNLFGLLIINKPEGMTSRRVVDEMQRHTGCTQIGHTGTLDPMATGVLLLALGNATRLVEYFHDLDKVYVADFEFGKSSDTLDRCGDVQPCEDAPVISVQQIESECRRWIGNVAQVPPQYSAIHVRGKRAYSLARAGIEFDLPPRPVRIERIEILEFAYPRLRLNIECGTGTYIRSLGRDIASGLGTCAIMTGLVRQSVGPFGVGNAIQLQDIRCYDDALKNLINPVRGLIRWQTQELSPPMVKLVGHGQSITLPDTMLNSSKLAAVDGSGQLIALLKRTDNDQWKPFRVFQAINATNQPTLSSIKHSPES